MSWKFQGGIYVPKFTDMLVEPRPIRLGVEGRFRLITHARRYGSAVRADFKNLILNSGLNRMGQGAWCNACQVGTGSADPDPTQTALSGYFAGTTTQPTADQNSYVVGPPPFHQMIRTRRFAEGTFSSTILAEVGMGWTTTTGNLFSRARILNSDDPPQPTTITLLSDEILDVEYTLRVYPDTSDWNGTVNISGTDYDVVARASGVGGASWGVGGGGLSASAIFSSGSGFAYPSTSTLGDVFNTPSGSATTSTSGTSAAYGNNDFYRERSYVWGLAANPSGGVGAVRMSSGAPGASFQMSFDPVIPKDNTKILTLVGRIMWDRYGSS